VLVSFAGRDNFYFHEDFGLDQLIDDLEHERRPDIT
jgi:hypothetical protein